MQKILFRENKIDRDKEHFWLIGLNASNKILFIELVSMGSVKATTVEPMNVFRVAVLKGAVNAILCHNHPSGELKASEADKGLTDRLIQVGRILDNPVLDHLIISPRSFISFAENGLLEKLKKSLEWVPAFEIVARIKAEQEKIRKEAVKAAEKKSLEKGKKQGLKEGEEKGKKQGIKEGVDRGRKEMAKGFKEKGFDHSVIAEISGLSVEEIEKL